MRLLRCPETAGALFSHKFESENFGEEFFRLVWPSDFESGRDEPADPVIPSNVEGSRRGTFKITSTGSLDFARDGNELEHQSVRIQKTNGFISECSGNFFGDHMICTQSLFPKCHRILWNGEADRGHLPTSARASSRSWPGKKCHDRSGTPDVIAEIEMVASGIVKIHGPFDQTQAERLSVKVETALRISRNCGDVVDAGAAHGKSEGERVA